MIFRVISPDCYVGGKSQNLVHCFFEKTLNFFLLLFNMILIFVLCACLSVIVRPKLKSRYKGRVKVAFDYAKTIDDFNNLIDPRTMYHHFLGVKPSPYFLRSLLM